MPHLEKDPLLTKTTDVAVNLQGLDGYTLKSKGTFVENKDKVNVSQNTKNLISNFVSKHKHKEAEKDTIIEEEKEDVTSVKDGEDKTEDKAQN